MKLIDKYLLKGESRTVIAKKNIFSSLLLKAISVLVSFILVPLTINYLNSTEYGIWLTLSAILVWVDFFDIGIGHGLRNKLAVALSNNDYMLGKQYVSSAYAFLTVLSILFFTVFAIINPSLSWEKILNCDYETGIQMTNIALWIVGFFCLRFVFKISGIILVADQKPAIDTLLNVIGNIISLILITILINTTRGSLFYAALSLSCTTPVVFIIATIFIFKNNKYKKISPSIKHIKWSHLESLLGLGLKFFIIQLCCLVIFSSSNFVLIQMFGPNEVTVFNIAFKFFSIITLCFSIVVTPLWTCFTDAYTKNDLYWIKNTTNKIKLLFWISSFITIIFVFTAKYFYSLWIGDSIDVPFSVTLSVGIYTIIYNLLSTYNYVINGVGRIHIQMLVSILCLILYFPAAIILCKTTGISGAINATSLMLIPLIVVAYIQYNKIINNKLTGIWNK